jgi:uncharacterized membrane protein (Fun14 family)
MTRRQAKQIRQQVKAILTQVGLGLVAGLIIGAVLALNL